ncbi:L-arabinose isomerase [Bifidobacterium actinocoloniiforme DSM 22766]|uniref:L-arabinose isomerase n=1 Tax=Bifidobacterium actinocoloniiforme DSM 22766 TaxID=1437605 RepID=A0A086Z224_9BIFI|nr:L-arabinose isomerase [Bifidobacterium actinocoloniiforme]AKV55996.1 arabinose isomerase [Bifidobacterium actinocoloniiforme DSM 22766]KFI40574.1 L-arabinose isomerase [Bifidobacterium actinocoloniiforme DSM 22766]
MENPFEGKEIWFGVGSQDLYGEDTLRQVAAQSAEIVDAWNKTGRIPVKLVLKPTLKSSDGIKRFMVEASADPDCIGVVAWMHTFSPAKMWIRGLEALTKPLLQLNTQHHFEIPWDTIDMDFMNLNQSAHGDREFGYILTRMGVPRKIVVGHYTDPQVAEQIGTWARACAGWDAAQNMRVMRWGDNMRNVAVTEGDKTEAERVFGTQVNTWAVNELVSYVDKVKDDQVKDLIEDYKAKYDVAPELLDKRYDSLFTAAKEEAGMVNMMEDYGATAAVDNFEDLGTLSQLPGVGAQRLPSEHGYGFSAEGDWKTSMLVRIGSVMGAGLDGGASLMEDYSYNFVQGQEEIMGSHMLEVSPSVGSMAKPKLEIHPLGIGGKADPVRLVFSVAPRRDAVVVSMADMRERFRLVMNVVDVVEPGGSLKVLPTARALWKPQPSLKVSAECWLRSGAAHHTCMTTSVGREAWEDFARIAGVELAVIDQDTTPDRFEKDMMMEEIYHRLDNQR